METRDAAAAMAEELRTAGQPERAAKERAYLKSEIEHWGVPLPAIRAVVRPRAKGLDRAHTMELAGRLWAEPVHERRMAAALLLRQNGDRLMAADLPRIEQWVRESRTWALVDTIVPHPVGGIADREPDAAELVLDRWAVDEDFWLRRAALLAHLVALREGRGDWARFTRYADSLLEEREFFIRKAIGWVLRDTARLRPEMVAGWMAPRAHRMSGVTIREAVKRLPPQQAEQLIAAQRQGRGDRQAAATAGAQGAS